MNSAPSPAKQIFLDAVENHAPDQWPKYLDAACGEDAELRRRVEVLLEAHAADESLLDDPAFEVAVTVEHCPIDEQPGTVIGPYKLLQQIGEGGFGVVFLAEQTRPVRREVALKIVKAGMDTKEVVARFETERQALAMMDHPNIAKVLGGGATESGRPYFVMELVPGIPITEYCDQCKLTTRERLGLFVSVCQAVQHAHQKGVIHRDLKPSNVLIAMQDRVATPKIIDFGVAKAVNQRLTEHTLKTRFAQIVGTPLYMSPEQAELSPLGVDTRSDIYSLGVLLYELLTGTTPFDKDRLHSASFDELRRIIREEEPPRPSNRLSTFAGDTVQTVADRHRSEVRQLTQTVRGDLDWIVMKAMEKDRSRRYETANGLARDVERYLNDQPVQACPPSAAYRLRKFVRRNRAALATVLAVMAALLVATAVSTWEATVARRAKSLAENRLAQANAISELFQEALQSANPESAKGADYTVRQMLDEISARLGDQFDKQPASEAAVRATIGNAYRSLGMYEQADPHLQRALQLREQLFGPEHQDFAISLYDLAWNTMEVGNWDDAESQVRRALAIHRKLGIRNVETASMLGLLQIIHIRQKRFEEAETAGREALAITKEQSETDPELANILHRLAHTSRRLGKLVEAEQLARESVALHRRLQGDEHPQTAWGMLELGSALIEQDKHEEAVPYLREAIDIFSTQYDQVNYGWRDAIDRLVEIYLHRGDLKKALVLASQHPEGGFLIEQLNILLLQGNVAEAETLIQEAPVAMDVEELNHRIHVFQESEHAQAQDVLSLSRANMDHQVKWHGRKSREAVLAMLPYADNLRNWTRNKQPESESLAREALSIAQSLYNPDHELVGKAYGAIGNAFWSQNRWKEAEEPYREELRIAEGLNVPKSQDEMYWIYWHLGTTLNGQSRYSEAEAFLRKAVEARNAERSDAHPLMIRAVYVLANNLQAEGKHEQAEAVYREELSRRQEVPNPRELVNGRDVETASLQLRLGQVLLAQGRQDEGEAMIQEAAKQDAPEVLNAIAWSLATDADPDKRDGETAVKLAERAVELTARKSDQYLDTLAAAYAEVGQFDDAVGAQQEAIALLADDQQNLHKEFELRLGLYEAKTPYRDHNVLASRATELLRQGQAVQAEPLARECLKIRETMVPDSWRKFNAQSLLGGSLLQQAKYDEAEPLLVSGYEGLAERADALPSPARMRPNEALQRLIQFYEKRGGEGDAERAAEYQAKSDSREPANAATTTQSQTP